MADISAYALSPTVSAIFAWRERTADRSFRNHLGASAIGKPCDRELWFGFRWYRKPRFNGRMLRLFETGQLAEARFVRELRGIGAEVWPVDPLSGRQWRVSAHGGHFGGSLDGVCRGIPESSRPHVVEFKTHGIKSFAGLAKGVKTAKPEHWVQMQVYMHLMDLDRALYLAVRKDDDGLYGERVKLDVKAAESALNRAERLIYGQRAPETRGPEWACQWCSLSDVCAGGRPELNCRTCSKSRPEEDGRWYCEGHYLSELRQRQGCGEWTC